MYRPNVGICLINSEGKIFAGKRSASIDTAGSEIPNNHLWQMPQGGVSNLDNRDILIRDMYKELWEETGLYEHHVNILGSTEKVRYDFPDYVINNLANTEYSKYIGQEQIWFYLKFLGHDSEIKLDNEENPEFADWTWVDENFLIENVVEMKKNIYRIVLNNVLV